MDSIDPKHEVSSPSPVDSIGPQSSMPSAIERRIKQNVSKLKIMIQTQVRHGEPKKVKITERAGGSFAAFTHRSSLAALAALLPHNAAARKSVLHGKTGAMNNFLLKFEVQHNHATAFCICNSYVPTLYHAHCAHTHTHAFLTTMLSPTGQAHREGVS